MTSRRIIVAVLGGAVLMLGVAACGGSESADEPAPQVTSAETATPATEVEPTKPTEAPTTESEPTTTTEEPECVEGSEKGFYETRMYCLDGEWVSRPVPRPTTMPPPTTAPPTTTTTQPPPPPTGGEFALRYSLLATDRIGQAVDHQQATLEAFERVDLGAAALNAQAAGDIYGQLYDEVVLLPGADTPQGVIVLHQLTTCRDAYRHAADVLGRGALYELPASTEQIKACTTAAQLVNMTIEATT